MVDFSFSFSSRGTNYGVFGWIFMGNLLRSSHISNTQSINYDMIKSVFLLVRVSLVKQGFSLLDLCPELSRFIHYHTSVYFLQVLGRLVDVQEEVVGVYFSTSSLNKVICTLLQNFGHTFVLVLQSCGVTLFTQGDKISVFTDKSDFCSLLSLLRRWGLIIT